MTLIEQLRDVPLHYAYSHLCKSAAARIAALEAALIKAADTFEEMASVSRALQRDIMASACMVAERGCREMLTTAETEGDANG